MQKINLNKKIKTLDGKIIQDGNEAITFKTVFLNLLGTYNAENGKEAIQVYDLGIKINNYKQDEFNIEDAEKELLKKAIEKNKIYVSIVIAQVLKNL